MPAKGSRKKDDGGEAPYRARPAKRTRKGGGRGEPPYGEERPTPPGNPDADPVRIHREYVERRVGGGAPATPEAYDRALQQWHQIPGAVSFPPTEVVGDAAHEAPESDDADDYGDAPA
jgi:hypothetical protein